MPASVLGVSYIVMSVTFSPTASYHFSSRLLSSSSSGRSRGLIESFVLRGNSRVSLPFFRSRGRLGFVSECELIFRADCLVHIVCCWWRIAHKRCRTLLKSEAGCEGSSCSVNKNYAATLSPVAPVGNSFVTANISVSDRLHFCRYQVPSIYHHRLDGKTSHVHALNHPRKKARSPPRSSSSSNPLRPVDVTSGLRLREKGCWLRSYRPINQIPLI